ncbi:ABC transporter substrate-binding protein [Pusillimonas noertemannii]|uniref:Amino acid/amide ABC transporter substrate-binding protein (HAAT family) n=1 Tax=Pusillimonas noertemannii TaxID=305977 RepID=A0A2U1CMS9_9BURK|nr:ABC transporter substrate-binding protein [Pusillimonas noertemannii]NYT68659.1 ABC transporter substrate-binding protein [Pusillimonas noertemannii]PVY62323.1 amino acid/amide ABC transporter substrate-binding protein (HAAT family) [Pusillimonas noertemannii]TFL10702.1 branched-chain amino acid ABC transporter substrate-binding protein [Pusillimonas noertemannii]
MKMTILAAALTACCAALSAHAAETVKIGLIEPLTGSVAYNGVSAVNGAKIAVAERNAKAGENGVKYELVVEDGQCQPSKTVSAAEKLIQKDQVPVIVGAFCSSATIAAMSVIEKYQVPMVSGISSKSDLTERGNKWFFRSAETDGLLAKAFAKILVDQLKLKKIAYIGVNDDWGRGGISEFSSQIEAAGGETAMKLYFDHGATDFYTLLTRVRAAKPDGVFVAAETQDGSILVKQMKEVGLESQVFGVGSWATADFVKLAGEAAEGIHAAVPYAYTIDRPENKVFVKEYQEAYNELPGKYSAAGYNALNIVMDAIERAGEATPQKIRDALPATDYKGPNGTFKFTDKGQGYGFDAVLVKLHEGAPQIVDRATVTPE